MSKSETVLYDGTVRLVFDPDAPRYRYIATDQYVEGLVDKPIRGVTTLMRDIIHKPDLIMWPMNEALGVLFDQQYDAATRTYSYGSPKKALLQPNGALDKENLEYALQAARKAHTRKADRGKDIGSMAHRMCELFLHGQKFKDVAWKEFTADLQEIPKELTDNFNTALKAVDGFIKWWKHVKGQVVATEQPVYSRGMQYAGTYDLLAIIAGKLLLIDIKTTNKSRNAPLGIYAENFLQLGAYSYAMREGTGRQVQDLAVVNIGKDGNVSVCTSSDLGLSVDQCERGFAFACRLHDWLEETKNLTKDAHLTSKLSLPSVEGLDANNKGETK